MGVVRLKPREACHRCGGSDNLPHLSHADCISAIGQEVRDLLTKAREKTRQQQQIVEEQARLLRERAKHHRKR